MVPNFETSTVITKTEFNHFQLTNKVVGLGGAVWGKFPPNVCGALFNGAPLPQMRPFLVPMELGTEIENTLK